MFENIQPSLEDETRKYLESHPDLATQLQRAENVYKLFGDYLRLTQPRIILHELAGGSNSEVDLSATVSRTNR